MDEGGWRRVGWKRGEGVLNRRGMGDTIEVRRGGYNKREERRIW